MKIDRDGDAFMTGAEMRAIMTIIGHTSQTTREELGIPEEVADSLVEEYDVITDVYPIYRRSDDKEATLQAHLIPRRP